MKGLTRVQSDSEMLLEHCEQLDSFHGTILLRLIWVAIPKCTTPHATEVVIFFTEDTWKVSGKYIYDKFHRQQKSRRSRFRYRCCSWSFSPRSLILARSFCSGFLFLRRIIIRGVVIDFALLLRGDHLPGKAQKSVVEINQSLFLTQPTNLSRWIHSAYLSGCSYITYMLHKQCWVVTCYK